MSSQHYITLPIQPKLNNYGLMVKGSRFGSLDQHEIFKLFLYQYFWFPSDESFQNSNFVEFLESVAGLLVSQVSAFRKPWAGCCCYCCWSHPWSLAEKQILDRKMTNLLFLEFHQLLGGMKHGMLRLVGLVCRRPELGLLKNWNAVRIQIIILTSIYLTQSKSKT